MTLLPSEASKTPSLPFIQNAIAIASPPLGFVAATFAIIFWEGTIHPLDLGLLVGMYALTFFGISVGYHRLFTHRAFQAGRGLRAFLAIAGCMAAQGPVTSWVSHHRAHHLFSDDTGDLHSPNLHGTGVWGQLQGFWHAHMGWLLGVDWTAPFPYVPDLNRDPVIQGIDRLYLFWVFLSLLIPTVLGGAIAGTWAGALQGLLWGGAVRIFLMHQFVFCVNSVCHFWGKRRFATPDSSRNHWFVAIGAFGEGWHHNHHAFPHSARFGLRWWEVDLGWLSILALKHLGLVWNVREPSSQDIEQAQA